VEADRWARTATLEQAAARRPASAWISRRQRGDWYHARGTRGL